MYVLGLCIWQKSLVEEITIFLSNFKLILTFNQMYMIPLETKDGENSSQIEQEQIN